LYNSYTRRGILSKEVSTKALALIAKIVSIKPYFEFLILESLVHLQ